MNTLIDGDYKPIKGMLECGHSKKTFAVKIKRPFSILSQIPKEDMGLYLTLRYYTL